MRILADVKRLRLSQRFSCLFAS